MPEGVNNLRIGEAILQGGLETFRDEPWRELEFDACRLTAELIEVKIKPSLPIGQSSYDAFGNQPVFVDEGDRLRAIANIGREDVLIDGLMPVSPGVRVLGASSDHLVMDVTDAEPPLAVGDRIGFRMNYGAMLAAMTSEYVEKAPIHDVEARPGRKMVEIIADPRAAQVLAMREAGERLEAMDYDVVQPGDADHPPAGLLRLSAAADRRGALIGMAAAVKATHSLGLIWVDSRPALVVPGHAGGELGEHSVLAEALGLVTQPGPLQPQLSPENVVLVGLREVTPAEAAILKGSRVTVFTMTDVDAMGMRDVMREAIRIVTTGTRGFHVSYSPTATEMPGWAEGSGGITVRETHQAMEAIALNGGMISMDVSGLHPELDARVAAETVSFVMSAFGKRIL